METAVTASVGFGSAVLGAAVGFMGAVYIERGRLHRSRVGIVRAMLGELRGNAAWATQVSLGVRGPNRISMRFSKETWEAAKFELAQFVKDDLFRKLLFIYETLPMIEQLSQVSKPMGSDDPARDLIDEWIEGVKEAMLRLLQLREAETFRSHWHIRLHGDTSRAMSNLTNQQQDV